MGVDTVGESDLPTSTTCFCTTMVPAYTAVMVLLLVQCLCDGQPSFLKYCAPFLLCQGESLWIYTQKPCTVQSSLPGSYGLFGISHTLAKKECPLHVTQNLV